MSTPKIQITKYFFGYYTYHGQSMCSAWAEEDGIPVGVPVLYTQRHEITEQEWETSTLTGLKLKYPLEIRDNS